MKKLYRVQYEVINQAERMRDKYYFLSENEMSITYESNNMSNIELEQHYRKSEEYYNMAEKIDKSLLNICNGNCAPWEDIIILKAASLQRDTLDILITLKKTK